MNKHIVLQCKYCGSIMVINKKDYFYNIRCTRCDSTNILNIDEIDENEVKIIIDEIKNLEKEGDEDV